MLYPSLLTALALVHAEKWLEDQLERMDTKIDKWQVSESERNQEKAVELKEVKTEIEDLRNDVVDCANAASDMLDALCAGDLTAVSDVVDKGAMQLDIGEADE